MQRPTRSAIHGKGAEVTTPPLKMTAIKRPRTHEEVVRKVRDEIFAGRLRAGDRLPPERELSEMLGVSRASVREGIRVLEALEVIEVHHAPGPGSGLMVVSRPGQALTDMLRLQLAMSHFTLDDVVDLRILLEGASARRAARHRTADNLVDLRRLVTEMRRPEVTVAEFNELDTQFHVAISAAADNVLLSYIMSALRTSIRQHMLAGFERVANWDATVETLRNEHEALLAAVEEQDEDRAEQIVTQHIISFYREIS